MIQPRTLVVRLRRTSGGPDTGLRILDRINRIHMIRSCTPLTKPRVRLRRNRGPLPISAPLRLCGTMSRHFVPWCLRAYVPSSSLLCVSASQREKSGAASLYPSVSGVKGLESGQAFTV